MMQKLLGVFIAVLVLVDAFFVSYAVGLNVRKVPIVDAGLTSTATATESTTASSDSGGTVASDNEGATVSGGDQVNVISSSTSTTSEASADVSSESTAATAKSFTDLKDTDQRLQSSLEKAAEAGILDPAKDKQFRPNEPVTRADFARWMVRIRQIPALAPDSATYSDVDSSNPYYQEIEGATKAMMVQGYNVKDSSQKEFKPDQNITRQEFAVMYGTFSGKRGRAEQLKKEDIDKFLKYNPSTSRSGSITFKDSGDVDDWALKWVAVANQAGVLEQCFDVDPYNSDPDKKYLHPQQQMTRAEAVNILVKLYGAQSRSAVQESKGDTKEDTKEEKPATADHVSDKEAVSAGQTEGEETTVKSESKTDSKTE